MKNMLIGLLLTLGFLSLVFADNMPSFTSMPANSTQTSTPQSTQIKITKAKLKKSGPCTNLVQACKAAGFVKDGAAQGKGLIVNCIRPILNNKTVARVTVDPNDVQDCQAHMLNRGNPKTNSKSTTQTKPQTQTN